MAFRERRHYQSPGNAGGSGIGGEIPGNNIVYQDAFQRLSGADLSSMPEVDRIKAGNLMQIAIETSIARLQPVVDAIPSALRARNLHIADEMEREIQAFRSSAEPTWDTSVPQRISPLEISQVAALSDLRVVQLLGQGKSNQEIAQIMGITPQSTRAVISERKNKVVSRLQDVLGGERLDQIFNDPHPQEMPRLNPGLLRELRVLCVRYGTPSQYPHGFVQRAAAQLILEYAQYFGSPEIKIDGNTPLDSVELPDGLRERAFARGISTFGKLIGATWDRQSYGLEQTEIEVIKQSFDHDQRMKAMIAVS